MSGTINPLATAPMAQPQPAPNPLATQNGAPVPQAAPQAPKGPPTVATAMANIAAQNWHPDQIADNIHKTNFTTAELGKLMQKSNVTRKDVVKATADAVGTRKISAEDGIKFISQ